MKTKKQKSAAKTAKPTKWEIKTKADFEREVIEQEKDRVRIAKAVIEKRERNDKASEAYNKRLGFGEVEGRHAKRAELLIAFASKERLGKSGTTPSGIQWNIRQLKDEVKLKGKITKDFLIRQLEKIFPLALDSALNKDKLRDGLHEDEKLAKKLAKWVTLKAKKSFNTKPGKTKK